MSSKLHSWAVNRRYAAFDALQAELWWRGIAPEQGLPPKRPLPGHDRDKLEVRAIGLQAWASAVLLTPDALNLASVAAFFDLDASRDAASTLLGLEACLDASRDAAAALLV